MMFAIYGISNLQVVELYFVQTLNTKVAVDQCCTHSNPKEFFFAIFQRCVFHAIFHYPIPCIGLGLEMSFAKSPLRSSFVMEGGVPYN